MRKIGEEEIREIAKLLKDEISEEFICECVKRAILRLDFETKHSENSQRVKKLDVSNIKKISVKEQITQIFNLLGGCCNLQGYYYARTAIEMCVKDMNLINCITKKLYPDIAKEYGTIDTRVERSIRHFIEKIWNYGNQEAIYEYFSYTVNARKSKPTNSEFIALIADKIRMGL